ncbi:hypothetical protein CEQ90_05820 [Lewinellaceae bacterium SD302]|nr:hypothetical protein CEQ90_05820 [Lewinellaceae bacterium SD302]
MTSNDTSIRISSDFSLDKSDIPNNIHSISNVIRVLIVKSAPELYQKYSDKDDAFFMHPLLFALFNNTDKSNDLKKDLACILDGDIATQSTEFGGIKLLLEIPDYVRPFFYEIYRGHISNEHPDFSLAEYKFDAFNSALELIKETVPATFEHINLSNKLIFIHDNPKIINFVTKSFQGFLSFWVVDEINRIYFVEELIHQGGHNLLNLHLHNKADFFTCNPDEVQMNEVNGGNVDYRSLMSAYHGLFTVIERIRVFEKIIRSAHLSEQESHELAGRFADQFLRFEKLNVFSKNIYNFLTPRGADLYNEMVDFGRLKSKEYKDFLSLFDLSFRDIDFYYSEFSKHNDIQKYLNSDFYKMWLNEDI